MKYTVFDTADDCTSKIAALKKAGITAIIRYDDPSQNPNSWKQIGGPEYNAILAAGMAVGIVSQWVNNLSVISMRFPASAMATTLCIGHNFVTNPRVRQSTARLIMTLNRPI